MGDCTFEGYQAFWYDLNTCPYNGGPEARSWTEGWLEAQTLYESMSEAEKSYWKEDHIYA